MSYVDINRRPSYSSMAAVVAIHAAVGAALITGLAATGVIEEPEVFTGIDIRKPPPPPVEPPKIEDPKPTTPEQKVFTPVPPLPIPRPDPIIDTTQILPPPQPPLPQPGKNFLSRYRRSRLPCRCIRRSAPNRATIRRAGSIPTTTRATGSGRR